jgi:DNA-binding MarR family transcriptional regulator
MKDKSEVLYLENQLCFPLYAASRLTTQIYTPLLDELGLTYPQYLVLLVLWQHGEMPVTEICNKLLLESNTVTPLLKRLEKKGIVNRRRSESDERSVIVSLTREGTDLKERAISIPEKIVASFSASNITEAEVIAFRGTLLKLLPQRKSVKQHNIK